MHFRSERATPLYIVINALLYSIGQDYRQTGISRYVDGLLGQLGTVQRENNLTALVSADAPDPEWPSVSIRRARIQSGDATGRIRWEQTSQVRDVRTMHPDIFHASANVIPVAPLGCRKSVMIHDLAFMRFPEQVTKKRYSYLRAMIGQSARRADVILTPSQSTANDVEELLGIAKERIRVTPLGVGPVFRPATAAQIEMARDRYGISGPYILTVGTIEPRKNLDRLVQAFASIADGVDHSLVLAGPQGWLTDSIEETIKTANVGDRIIRTGFVDDEGLVGLYSGADLVALPSLYEGFGLPVIEAMACGAPVLTSSGSSLGEVAGDAADLVDPSDVDAIAQGILTALTRDGDRQIVREKSIDRARQFTWQRTAELTLAAWQEVLS